MIPTGFDPHALHSIYVIRIPFATIYCKAFLAQTVAPKPESFIASSIILFSASVSRTDIAGVLCWSFGLAGLPAFFVINNLRYTIIIVDSTVFPLYDNSKLKLNRYGKQTPN